MPLTGKWSSSALLAPYARSIALQVAAFAEPEAVERYQRYLVLEVEDISGELRKVCHNENKVLV